ncbi:MAG: serine/threonine protein kinase, partial [Planctomycetaceae bacterium]|nr:serine/threonine protein kinase [Planctomycetaceae bacterium]
MGVGGMGIVFRAEDLQLKRQIALKVMKPSAASSRSARDRFLREAQATAAIDHHHIVAIHQVGEDGNIPFIAMQYLRGESLQARLKREHQLSQPDVLRIGREVASGLAAAHEQGLIHRDIKPDNIWIDEATGWARILDFGLARIATDDAGLTRSGIIVGTPRYMAPEQAQGDVVDHRCDLFSLGSVLYHLLAGRPPFRGRNVTATLIAVTQEDPPALQAINPALDQRLCDLIMSLLNKDPEQRPQKAQDVCDRLAEIEAAPLPAAIP